METGDRKRAREGEETEDPSRAAKKSEFLSYTDGEIDTDQDEGVFDFPWLKEGVIFKAENDCLELEDVFASFEVSPSISSFEFPSVQLVNFPHDDEKIDLPSWRVDELEGADWICGSAIDDPPLPPNKVVA
ncbi:hypothetical protein Acr_00g0055860 [Actinidia rufa]|uniref:Uncharacterized protein n=1 Tax=Actinidia rufa TaxID=165716 RepID=A0A7J0DMA5_9ERIC|nr:hypothetical protein Acr_00g0055860 [Actinidia rufa]